MGSLQRALRYSVVLVLGMFSCGVLAGDFTVSQSPASSFDGVVSLSWSNQSNHFKNGSPSSLFITTSPSVVPQLNLAKTATSATISGLPVGTTTINVVYTGQFSTGNTGGARTGSVTHTVTVAPPPPVVITPNRPSSLSVNSANEPTVTLSWPSISNANYYNIEADNRDDSAGYSPFGPMVRVTNNQATDTLAGGLYRFRVRACNDISQAASCSAWRYSSDRRINALDSLFNVNGAPTEFQYDLGNAGIAEDFTHSDFVAITQGSMGVKQGAASYSIPIKIPPAINNLAPNLALIYDSENTSSRAFGVGWAVSGLSAITRCAASFATEQEQAQKPNPKFSDGDRLCLNGQKLVLRSGSLNASDSDYWSSSAEYMTEQDSVIRIRKNSQQNGFIAESKGGLRFYYGSTHGEESRVYRPGNYGGDIMSWKLSRVEDRYGNSYSLNYQYNTASNENNIRWIDLSPGAQVVFNYEDRGGDYLSGYTLGEQYRVTQRLSSITTYTSAQEDVVGSGQRVSRYRINTKFSPITDRLLVDQIYECGFDAFGTEQCAKPLTFDWSEPEVGFEDEYTTMEWCDGLQQNTRHCIQDPKTYDLLSAGHNFKKAALTHFGVGYFRVDPHVGEATQEINVKFEHPNGDIETLTVAKRPVPQTVPEGQDIPSHSADGYLLWDNDSESTFLATLGASYGAPKLAVGDFNSDGLTDFFFNRHLWIQKLESGKTVFKQQAPLAFDARRSAMVQDTNQDGLLDIYGGINNGNGGFDGVTGSFRPEGLRYALNKDKNAYEPFYGDFNGDGLLDSHRGINGGSSIKELPAKPVLTGVQIIDINRDGKDDLVYRTVVNGEAVIRAQIARINNEGQVYFDVVNTDPLNGLLEPPLPPLLDNGEYYFGNENYMGSMTLEDINGDGRVDYFLGGGLYGRVPYYKNGERNEFDNAKVILAKRGQPDMLASVTDGFGAAVKLDFSELVGDANAGAPLYTASTLEEGYPYKAPSLSKQVVKTLSSSNGVGGFNNVYYNYHGGRVDVTGRGFSGFEKITTTNEALKIKTVAEYNVTWPLSGKPAKQTVTAFDGGKISVDQYFYKTHPDNPRLVVKEREIKEIYQLEASPISVEETVNTHDKFGNLREQYTYRAPQLSNNSAQNNWTHITGLSARYNNDEDNWLIGFAEWQQTLSMDADFNVAWHNNYFTPEPGTVDTKTVKRYANRAVESLTTYTRNSQGVVTQTLTSAADDTQTPSADRASNILELDDGLYPTRMRNAKGHETYMEYEKRFGKVNFTRDANGLESSITYDSLGRSIKTVSPTGAETHIKNFYCDNAPISCPERAVYLTTTITQHPLEGEKLASPLTIQYYDSLQRVISTETFAIDGSSVKQDTEYDSAGRLLRVSEPYTLFPMAFTTYANYNALGEAQTITAADGGAVSIAHWQEGNLYVTEKTVTVADSNSNNGIQITLTYTNELGQVVRVEDADNTPTTYAYDPAGNLKETIVNNNAATKVTINHDAAGNKLWIQDPAAGRIDYVYNGFGELREQIWQKGTASQKSMRFDYDVLGRKIKRVDTPVTESQKTYEWMYDVMNKGTLFAELDNSYHKVYFYDEFMRLSTTREYYGEGYIDANYSYDNFSRPETTTYPSGLKVKQIYHATGVPVQTLDITTAQSKLLWALGDTVDERGNYTYQLMGNGVVTEQSFDELNGLLRTITSGKITSGSIASLQGTLQKLSYDWDSIGNLQQRRSERVNSSGSRIEDLTQNFMYDSLNRLDHAHVFGLGAIPSMRDYQYDAYGNLTHNGQSEQVYGKSNGASIYGVTRANNINYHYDAYGNVVQRGNTLNEYDVFNKPTQLGNTQFWYGANHDKIKQKNGNKTTYFYMGGQYEVEDNNGTKTTTSYAGSYMQKKVGSTITHRYRLFDHLGSTDTILNENGSVEERMAFDPFGNTLETHFGSGALANAGSSSYKGYTGHDMLDGLGLIHMGGRVYDPTVGRFLSADLFVQSPYNSQSYNRYSYVFNNPLGLVDPSGYSSESFFMSGLSLDNHYAMNITFRWVSPDFDASQAVMPSSDGIMSNAFHAEQKVSLDSLVKGYGINGQMRLGTVTYSEDIMPGDPEHTDSNAKGTSLDSVAQKGDPDNGGFSPIPGTYFDAGGNPVTVKVGPFGGTVSSDGTTGYDFDTETGMLYNPLATGAASQTCPSCYLIGGAGVYKALFSGAKSQYITVTSWAKGPAGTANLSANRWVMVGGPTRLNFIRTGLWGPQMTLRPFSFSWGGGQYSSITREVLRSRVGYGPGLDGAKGALFGQRYYRP